MTIAHQLSLLFFVGVIAVAIWSMWTTIKSAVKKPEPGEEK